MTSKRRDWRILAVVVSTLVFAIVFTWLSIFGSTGFDGDAPVPIRLRVVIAAGLAGPVLVVFFLANIGRPRWRGGRAFEVTTAEEPRTGNPGGTARH
jgi:hypothetical protein